MKLTRIVKFFPAWDKRNPDPKKNYGIHGVELLMLLKGKEGAVQFRLSTNWHLPSVQKELDAKWESNPQWRHISCHPLPTDLGYHSYIPRYEGQTPISKECEWLEGKTCYYDGSSLNAEDIYKKLLIDGDGAVWEGLEEYYKDRLK